MKMLFVIMLLSTVMPVEDSVRMEKIIPELTVTAKQSGYLADMPIAATTLGAEQLEVGRVESVKDMSAVVPNFYQPDYGSAMTSSLYVRGFGSRIDQPVLGMNVDEVPVMNKNAYDFDLFDIYSVDLLRGPQSTLYGRNTSGGVINMRTLSPLNYQGTRLMMDYGTANSLKAKLSHYFKTGEKTGLALSGFYSRTDGYFRNEFTDENCDDGQQAAIRMRLVHAGRKVRVDNTLAASWVDQGGYAYRLYDGEELAAVNYNDPSRYERLMISNGTSVKIFLSDGLMLSSITGLQYLDDEMNLDNDFTPANIFTLRQSQREYSLTQDFVLRTTDSSRRWQHITGVFGFHKSLDMDAPVVMKRDGIEQLILAGANKGMQSVNPAMSLDIEQQQLDLFSTFDVPVWGAAFYHQSDWTVGRLKFTAGVRFDYETTSMKYDSHVDLSYRLAPFMPVYAPLRSEFVGKESQSTFEILPKAAVTYNMHNGNIYFTASRGYKAGGFNTQIFSDILRERLMGDMMAALGVGQHGGSGGSGSSAATTSYEPEYAWNYELGGHFSRGGFSADAALFYIDCRNQQLTVFPSSTSMGRIMSNAGRSESYGVELSAAYELGDLILSGAYGYTHAEFSDYNDGKQDLSGNRMPYAPQSTFSAAAHYTIELGGELIDEMFVRVQTDGVGKIYWNDTNTLWQNPYALLSASVGVRKGASCITLWGKNLTDRKYETFYFESTGNGFFSSGRPRCVGVTLSFDM